MQRSLVFSMLVLGLSLCIGAATPSVADWSQQFPSSWTWQGATDHAASLVEAGFTDWRLATRAEWQAAIQAGTVGPLQPNIPPGNYFWTADTQGPRAWMVQIATDSNGNVIASQSGATMRVLKGSATFAVAVR